MRVRRYIRRRAGMVDPEAVRLEWAEALALDRSERPKGGGFVGYIYGRLLDMEEGSR